MTQEEKRRIGEMRAAGCSYIRIAAELNISVNSIKSYCRRHRRYRKHTSCRTRSTRFRRRSPRVSNAAARFIRLPAASTAASVRNPAG